MVGGDLDHRPELAILVALTAEASETAGPALLRRWLRATGAHGRPLDLLLTRDFATFEDALEDLRRRGFVVRSGSR